MHPHVQNMVNEQCELAKQKMKEKPAAELGSFQKDDQHTAVILLGYLI